MCLVLPSGAFIDVLGTAAFSSSFGMKAEDDEIRRLRTPSVSGGQPALASDHLLRLPVLDSATLIVRGVFRKVRGKASGLGQPSHQQRVGHPELLGWLPHNPTRSTQNRSIT